MISAEYFVRHTLLAGGSDAELVYSPTSGCVGILKGFYIINTSDTSPATIYIWRGGTTNEWLFQPERTLDAKDTWVCDSLLIAPQSYDIYVGADLADTVVVWVDGMEITQ